MSIINLDERAFIVDSGACLYAKDAQEGIETRRNGNHLRLRLPMTVITSDGSIDTTEET